MALTIKDFIITGQNNPGKKLLKEEGFVVHWTANRGNGANALANVKFFQNTKSFASCQFAADDTQVVRCIREGNIAYHVGAKSYTATGKKFVRNGYSPNFFLTGVEMCVNADSDFKKMEQNTIDLIALRFIQKNWSVDTHLYRHYDITGKACPDMYLDARDWNEFKNQIQGRITQLKANPSAVPKYEVQFTLKILNDVSVRKGPNTSYPAVVTLKAGTQVTAYEWTDGFFRVDKGWIVDTATKQVSNIPDPEPIIMSDDKGAIYGMVVNTENVNVRTKPVVDKTTLKGTLKKGTIVKILSSQEPWYNTEKGWIHGTYIDVLEERKLITLSVATDCYSDIACKTKVSTLPAGKVTTAFLDLSKTGSKVLRIKEGYIKI